jgi:cystathionine beta-lyase
LHCRKPLSDIIQQLIGERDRAIHTDFDEIIDRTGTASLKWELYRGKDVIPLWVADMDLRSPPAVVEALRARVDHGVFGYTLPPAELVEVIAALLLEEYDWRTEQEWIVWLPGLVSGLNVSCTAAGEDGDDVLTAVPVYPPFLSAPGNTRRNLVTTRLVQEGNRWRLDMETLERTITPRTRLLLLCNPHNPVGRVYDREELSHLARLCEKHNLVICSDEIHAGLVLDADKKHVPIATLSPEIAARTITLMAPSKTYNLPGLGCSFAIISDPGIRERFNRVMNGIVPHVNTLGYTAALAAYRDSREWRSDLLEYLRGNRDMVAEAVGRMPGLSVNHVEATYLSWIDVRDCGLDDPVGFFERAGVGLSDGAAFGGPGYVRLNFGCPRKLLREALERMERALHNKSGPR